MKADMFALPVERIRQPAARGRLRPQQVRAILYGLFAATCIATLALAFAIGGPVRAPSQTTLLR